MQHYKLPEAAMVPTWVAGAGVGAALGFSFTAGTPPNQ